MQGLMMDVPLLISSLIRHADRHHGDTEIVSRTVEGGIHRYNYAECELRSKKLAQALLGLEHPFCARHLDLAQRNDGIGGHMNEGAANIQIAFAS